MSPQFLSISNPSLKDLQGLCGEVAEQVTPPQLFWSVLYGGLANISFGEKDLCALQKGGSWKNRKKTQLFSHKETSERDTRN